MYQKFKTIIKVINFFFKKDEFFEKKFIKYNLANFKKSKNHENILLIDYFESFESEIARSFFSNIFCKKYNCNLTVFSLSKNILFNLKWRRIYKSINAKNFFYIFFSINYFFKFFDFKNKKFIKDFITKLKSKNDILEFKYRDLSVGRDIIDEYLYRYKKATVDLNDQNLYSDFYDCLYTIDFWIKYFKKNKVKAVSLSHTNVRLLGLVGKVANRYFQIPVYSVTNTYVIKNEDLSDHYKWIRSNLMKLRIRFDQLTDIKKEEAINWSKKQLEKKFSGEVGVDMYYSTKSAFGNKKSPRALSFEKKTKVMICTHEFYDNPHATGGLLFSDFYEWLEFLGEKSQSDKYDWYIKSHPDCDNWTISIINKYVERFPKIKIVNSETSFIQLKDEGLNFALTCHGTIGHECPLLNIQVINADLNHPHIAYNFNWSPKSIKEYDQIINNLENLNLKINSKEIYQFYYMYKKHQSKDDLIFKSYKDAKRLEKNNKNILNIFLEEADKKRHEDIVKNISNLI